MAQASQIPAESIAAFAHPLHGSENAYDPLIHRVRDCKLVLLGESSHGTQQFYHERIKITRRLIQEHHFNAVAIEGDWPDANRVNRYIKALSGDATAEQALADFRRFPAWLWRNTEMLQFVAWLRAHNDVVRGISPEVGLFGLDLYSLHASIDAVLTFLDKADPAAAVRARQRYGCFDLFAEDPYAYGHAATLDISRSCEDEAVRQLVELQSQRSGLLNSVGAQHEDELFHAEQNARVVKGAEQYYRSMFRGQVTSWNLRDTHMADTLDAVVAHEDRHAGSGKVVVWAHNTHVGDARATELATHGELNLGQLCRERYGDDVALVGFTTYGGSVTAALEWGAPARRRRVLPGMRGSYEELLHISAVPRMLIDLSLEEAAEVLHPERLQRAIGVIYRPESERRSHYFFSHLADQFDALVHLDHTHALQPLEQTSEWVTGELAETWPSGV